VENEPPEFRFLGYQGAWPAAISALRHRNYRLFWTGQLVSLIGTWMQNAAQGWLVYQLATSEFGHAKAPLYIGMVSAFGMLPIFLFTLFAGVLSDQYDRRRILLITQTVMMLLAAGLGLLVQLGTIRLWEVGLFSFGSGLAMAFDMPTRQAFVKDMSSPRDLLNAIALNSTIFNLARILGPATVGYITKFGIGISGALYVNAASFIAVIIGLTMIRIAPTVRPPLDLSVLQRLREGFSYAWHQHTIRLLLLMMAIFSIFGFSYAVLIPLIVGQLFKKDISGFANLTVATGVGALIGAIVLASLARKVRKGQTLFFSGLTCVVSLMAFALCHNYLLSLCLLPFTGAGLVVASASINSLIQEIVPDKLRGRVVSIWAFIFAGFAPIGALYAGTVASLTSPETSIFIGALVCLAFICFLSFRTRWFWHLR
jgi:MFS family permease